VVNICNADSLVNALNIGRAGVVSLVGGGGKSTLMRRLVEELASGGKRVINTTTTHIFPHQASGELLVDDNPLLLLEKARHALGICNCIALGYNIEPSGKIKGIDPQLVSDLQSITDYIIVEADGAACKPLKAPNHTEPVIPAATNLVVAVVGIDCLDKTIQEAVFRPEVAVGLIGGAQTDIVTTGIVADLLLHDSGIAKGCPPSAAKMALINKVEERCQFMQALEIAEMVVAKQVYSRVIIGNLLDQKPILAMVDTVD
jgi:probable selenium-dependent hydroxylase accessory protein YqeC